MRLSLILVVAPLLLVPPVARGATVLPLDLQGLVKNASLAFYATVAEVETVNLGSATKPRIVTDVRFDVARTLLGKTPGAHFALRLAGGTWGGYTLDIPGQPTFEVGQEIVLFLEWTGLNWAVVGMSQGRYQVYKGKDGKKWTRRTRQGLSLFTRNVAGKGVVEPVSEEEPPVRFDAFLKAIKQFKSN